MWWPQCTISKQPQSGMANPSYSISCLQKVGRWEITLLWAAITHLASEHMSKVGRLVSSLCPMCQAWERDYWRPRCPHPRWNWPGIFGTWMTINCKRYWRPSKPKLPKLGVTPPGSCLEEMWGPLGRVSPTMGRKVPGGRRHGGIVSPWGLPVTPITSCGCKLSPQYAYSQTKDGYPSYQYF